MGARRMIGVADPRVGLLATVLPAGTTRVRVDDDALGAALTAAGMQVVDGVADVAIATKPQSAPNAAVAIALVTRPEPHHRSRVPRAVSRVKRSLSTRVAARRAQRRLEAAGYRTTLIWEQPGEPVALPGLPSPERAHLVAHRFPLVAIVVGRCSEHPTMLEEALTSAELTLGRSLDARSVTVGSSGILLVRADDAFVRVAPGESGALVDRQCDALEFLATQRPSVAARVPLLLGSGRTGIVRWSAVTRLDGESVPSPLPGSVLDDCVAFLADLFVAAGSSAPALDPQRAASVVADAAPVFRRDLRALATSVARHLTRLPRGYAHLDFWAGNLLVRDGRLTGVVDWASGGPGRPPLLDLMHLRLSDYRELGDRDLGTAFLRHLWPCRLASDPYVGAYCHRLELALDEEDFRALATTYWLVATARELWDSSAAEHVRTREWREVNIDSVLDAFRHDSAPPTSAPRPVAVLAG